MKSLLEQLNNFEIHHRSEEQTTDLELIYKLMAANSTKRDIRLLRQDFDKFILRGRFIVLNTFAGGIIFLREPETIEKITLEFIRTTNQTLASVEYATEKRNARNIKYKPNTGKFERINWHMVEVFPNFWAYEKSIQIILMMIIGKTVKRICEYYNKCNCFVKYEKAFNLELFLDGVLELDFNIEEENNPLSTEL